MAPHTDQQLQLLAAALADRYRVDRPVGSGGMAQVYLAQDLKHQRPVAIKVLRPELTATVAADRFLQEIQVAAQLTHPRILTLIDSGVASGLLYYVMPYVDGETLRERLNREKQLPVHDAVEIAQDVASALSYAHKQGVVHRDVKPENILLSEGEAVIADFGIGLALTAAAENRLTGSGLAIGTPAYMSPEQASGWEIPDARSDIYSLGCVLYEMLAGDPPFDGPTAEVILAKHRAARPPSARLTRRAVPEAVEQVIARSLEKVPADRFPTAGEFSAALAGQAPAGVPVRTSPRVRRLGIGVFVTVVLVAAAIMWIPRSPRSVLDPTLIAIAPFAVYDESLAIWEEGLVDILSSNLDGAGQIRTVSPSLVVQGWDGRATMLSAVDLGQRTAAGFVVYGRVLPAGPDSVRTSATLVDVQLAQGVADFDIRQRATRMDQLADSLTVAVLRRLGQRVDLGTGRLTSLGAASLAALKDFLRGEYFLRRTRWDSAVHYYGEAIRRDSGFALAFWRQKTALWSEAWSTPDSAGDRHALRAGQLNHGLAPRESLLITVDSLWASLSEDDSLAWMRMRRIFTTLDYAAERYPSDPWVWYKIGEARWHLPLGLDYTIQEELDPFDRAIALDSSFGFAYYTHPVELALILSGPEEALRYIRGFRSVALPGIEDSAAHLTERLLDPELTNTRPTRDLLDQASADVLYRTAANLDMWYDSAETALMVARLLVARERGSPQFTDPVATRLRLARILAVRGHLSEAYAQAQTVVDFRNPQDEALGLFAELALFPIIPADSTDAVFDTWLRVSPEAAIFALPWWAAQSDTAALKAARHVLDSLGRAAPNVSNRMHARYGSEAALAYVALARRDTALALQRFSSLPDSLCPDCYLDWKVHAELLLAHGELERAKERFTRVLTLAWNVPTYPLTVFMLGRIEERLGNREAAIRAYRTTAEAWRHGDPVLRPYVEEARQALRRLGAG